MAEHRDVLVELGTEELPSSELHALGEAFRANLVEALGEARLTPEDGEAVEGFATPRRLAARIPGVPERQPDDAVRHRGPPVSAAFDGEGRPTRAAEGFARRRGADIEALERDYQGNTEYLYFTEHRAGRATVDLLPELVDRVAAELPANKRMRWADRGVSFPRPVHWVVLLFGDDPVPGYVLDQPAGRESRGHRFHAPEPLPIQRPSEYRERLRSAWVIADPDERREVITRQTSAEAERVDAQPRFDPELVDEVTALVEWPVALVASFDERFLELPDEVVVATLENHQRYFPLFGKESGELCPQFVAVSNIASRDPDEVRRGNERVVRPRLADAEFFWHEDRRHGLERLAARLREVTFQQHLGSLDDKTRRVAALTEQLAGPTGADTATGRRAAELAKADLLSEMVGEFPELQGIMGAYYAREEGEPEAVAKAIGEQYRPGHAGDAIPETPAGRALALADRLDTLSGIFAVGERPSGDKDPFALRRAALGVLRILIEGDIELDLPAMLRWSAEIFTDGAHPEAGPSDRLAEELYDFVFDRFRGYYTERGGRGDVFEAVRACRPASPRDALRRLEGVERFRSMPEHEALAAAHKRIANILRKAGEEAPSAPDPERLEEPGEQALHEALEARAERGRELVDRRDYGEALAELAQLREPVDRFFDEVLVMAKDPQVRANRLALLAALQREFLAIADLSRLEGG